MSGLNSVLAPRPTGKWGGGNSDDAAPPPFSVPLPVSLGDDDNGVFFAGADFVCAIGAKQSFACRLMFAIPMV